MPVGNEAVVNEDHSNHSRESLDSMERPLRQPSPPGDDRVRLRPCHTPHVKAAARRLDEAADLMARELLGMATQVQTPRYKIDTAVYSR
jgi:hypothetical protein